MRFYGLLKTIGTTGRQIKRIISHQALLLSAVGIPVGMVFGYGMGVMMTRIVVSQLNGVSLTYSINPVIFLGAAAFSLVTVWISCRKPRRMAAKIPPVEAVRYTEGNDSKRKRKRGEKGASIFRMAVANLGRNKTKTVITVISLSFAVVILNLTFILTSGFDMDKYLKRVVTDFITADASYFQPGHSGIDSFPEEVTAQIEMLDGVKGGRTYMQNFGAQEFTTEEWIRKS